MENKNGKKRINIGVLIGKVNTYHPRELVHGIYRAAQDHDVNVIYLLGAQRTQDDSLYYAFGDVRRYDYQMNTVYDYANLSGVDALIISFGTICVNLSPEGKENFLEKFKKIPYIVLEDETDGNYIISDNYQGIKDVMTHLVEDHRYTRIAMIAGPDGNMDAMQRLAAYKDSMQAYDLEIKEGYIVEGDFSSAAGQACASKLLEMHPDLEAIVCANDETAIGVFAMCKKMGLRVGEDIAITGYDNCRLAQDTDPPMTTLEQNGYDMGYRALIEALNLINANERVAVKMPAIFYKRGSCGCAVQKKDTKYAGHDPIYFLEHVDEIASGITELAVLNRESEELFEKARAQIRELIEFMLRIQIMEIGPEQYDRTHLVHLMRTITTGRYSRYISISVLLKEVNDFLQYVIPLDADKEKRMRLYRAITNMNEYTYSHMMRMKEQEHNIYQTKTNMNPFFERKLMED
ncbi:MAG: substrate-binding domain-containing protein, partial [Lachnospiraceae bacterium]|nr:substrate-binding domain-containing protein [Lachnospiraceae bacterium]